MTNIKSIAGGTVWMLVAAFLIFAALEPVTVESGLVKPTTVAA